MSSLYKSLQVIAAFALLTLATVLICFTFAFTVEIEMLASGFNKYLSLGVAILSAIGCNIFLVFNHKIRNFIKQSGS